MLYPFSFTSLLTTLIKLTHHLSFLSLPPSLPSAVNIFITLFIPSYFPASLTFTLAHTNLPNLECKNQILFAITSSSSFPSPLPKFFPLSPPLLHILILHVFHNVFPLFFLSSTSFLLLFFLLCFVTFFSPPSPLVLFFSNPSAPYSFFSLYSLFQVSFTSSSYPIASSSPLSPSNPFPSPRSPSASGSFNPQTPLIR